MNLLNSINRVDQLHQLIQLQKTGTPKQLAVRLGVSRAKLYMWILLNIHLRNIDNE